LQLALRHCENSTPMKIPDLTEPARVAAGNSCPCPLNSGWKPVSSLNKKKM